MPLSNTVSGTEPGGEPALHIDALRAQLAQSTGQAVRLIETHLSWVLLTAEYAYKLKRPVCLPFVDFRQRAARLQSCEEELRQNRRLAPSLYLDVCPVWGPPEAPELRPADAPPPAHAELIDHAVRMRRFPDEALLATRLGAGRLDAATLDCLALRLARFHAEAPVSTQWGEPPAVTSAAQALLHQLAELAPDNPLVPALAGWLATQSQALQAAWQSRRQGGHVRECHGDLHLANLIALDAPESVVTAFDAIEFDPALRWIDTMADLAFVTMDLQAHGASPLAYAFLDSALQASGDYEGLAVLPFYEVQRALVRALVAGLGGSPGGPDYLGWAHQRALVAPSPRLLITHGLSGSGKSYVARALLQEAGAVRLRSDVERKRLHGLQPLQRSLPEHRLYEPDATARTFERLRQLAGLALQAGYPVIVDAAFLRRSEREAFHALAQSLGLPFGVLDCQADIALLHERVKRRAIACTDPSEADAQVLTRQREFAEPLAADEQAWARAIDTAQALDVPALAAWWRGLTARP
jgi:aminoglycoside phosphotransferase family enzyme/predicted kinase